MTVVSIVVVLLCLPASLRMLVFILLDSMGMFVDNESPAQYNQDETQGGSSVPGTVF